jgi:hypothetical protein
MSFSRLQELRVQLQHTLLHVLVLLGFSFDMTLVAFAQAKAEKSASPVAKSKTDSTATGDWKNLFDGKTLTGWKATEFGGQGEVKVDPKFKGTNSVLFIGAGETLSGMNWTNAVPKLDYEVELTGMKVDGSDFWCGLTFPVGESHATLVLGGWGGGTVGISSIDGNDASENETTTFLNFEKGRWFKVRLRVTKDRLTAWLDDEKIIDQDIKERRISLRFGDIELSKPLGIATYQTTAAFREIKLRKLEAK